MALFQKNGIHLLFVYGIQHGVMVICGGNDIRHMRLNEPSKNSLEMNDRQMVATRLWWVNMNKDAMNEYNLIITDLVDLRTLYNTEVDVQIEAAIKLLEGMVKLEANPFLLAEMIGQQRAKLYREFRAGKEDRIE
jgi:hypothetical protein